MMHRLKWLASVLLCVLVGCVTHAQSLPADFPAGDAARGAVLFSRSINGAPPCSTCHSLDGADLSGPTMQGYAELAGTRVEGQSAEVYTYLSIVQPAAYIVAGYGNIMYNQYGNRLSDQQIADLMAFLLTQ